METVKHYISNHGLSPPRDAQRCVIDDLPNELLHLMFSFIPFGDDVKYTETGEPRMEKQVMVLRSVSRRFRALTNDSDFWGWMVAERVEWADLIPERGHTRTSHTPIERRAFFEALFSDEYLCDRLAKTCEKYNFTCVEVAQVITERVDITKVYWVALRMELEESLADCLALMPRFRNITELIVLQHPKISSLDLNIISTAFPHLFVLHLGTGTRYHGSLERLATLKKFLLCIADGRQIRDFIPSASALSLTTFTLGTLGAYLETTPEDDAPVELSKLSNVQILRLYPFFPRINDRINFKQLLSLTVWIDSRATLRFFAHAFPLLRQLQILDVTVRQDTFTDQDYMIACFLTVNYITDPSAVFQQLSLAAALDLGLAQFFTRLPNLSRLQWKVTPDFYWHEACKEHPQYESIKDHPEILFLEVFREVKKPLFVEISVDESHRRFLRSKHAGVV